MQQLIDSGLVRLAQAELDTDGLAESGLSDISGKEAIIGAAIFVGAIILSGFVRRWTRRLVEKRGHDTLAPMAGRFAAFAVVIIGFFYALSAMEVRAAPLLGALGIAGIALAFALQEIISNFVSGTVLQLRHPFRVNDQIVTNEYEGVVEEVNFRTTTLRTFGGEQVYLPNSMVLQNPIVNWTKSPTRRTSLVIGVAYDADLAESQRIMLDAMKSCEQVEDDPEPRAHAFEFGDNSVNFTLMFWHKAPIRDMWETRDEVSQAVKKALDDAGIAIPFPQRTLWFGPGNEKLSIASGNGESGASPS